MTEFDTPLNRNRLRVGRGDNLWIFIQDGEDFFGGGKRGLKRSKLLCQFLYRLKERTDIGDKDKKCAQGERAV